MRVHEKLLYMVVGGGLVALGQALPSFLPLTATAQLPTEQTTFEKVVCTSLTILDPSGQPRVSLLPGDEGGVVAVFGRDGVVRSVIGADESGGTALVSDKSGKPRAAMRVTDQGGSLMTLGTDGAKQSVVGTSPTGGELSVYATNGQLRGAVVVLENGAAFSAHGTDGKKRAILGVDPSGHGSVQTYGNDGRRSGGLPLTEFDIR
jgi:hypothetical protein